MLLSDTLWIELPPHDGGGEEDPCRIKITALPRVGIDYASDADRRKLWRFRLDPDGADDTDGVKWNG